jgi:KUP system potassium uptake protein
MSTQPGSEGNATRSALALGALGVVFGDIGTSPLYALRECMSALPDVERIEGVLGALSLVFWALMFEVVFKYVTFVTRADNRGEGGIFALLALSSQGRGKAGAGIGKLTLVILFGAALLYGDGIITPAISVLGAAEGLKSFNPGIAEKHVMLISCVILAALFAFQRKGTKAIGRIFGPAMCVWFIVLGGLGLWNLTQAPQVLAALNPMYGLRLLLNHPADAVPLLGAVVLVITGSEALYADMGHFGRKAIARAWYFGAFPGLVLNYFGQGAHVLAHPHDPTNPFFALVPEGGARLVLTGLSIVAAIIASQAMISGTFSLTRQAIQLGYFPRLLVRYTNPDQSGQIYLPLVNTLLALGSLFTVLMFRSSNNLAAAYGIAVTGTMVVTTIAFFSVLVHHWKWPVVGAIGLTAVFLTFDLLLFGSNLPKLFGGGWFPIVVGIGMLATMHTWKKGKQEIFQRVYANEITEDELRNIAGSERISRVRGTSVFMAGNPTGTPLVLLHHVKANKVLHETVVLLSIMTEEVPTVPAAERLTVRDIGEGVWRAVARYGYMESPDVSAIMEEIRGTGVPVKLAEATYYFNREMIITGGTARMPEWQKHYYAFLSRNARTVRDYYNLPPMQIIEVGLPIQL